MKECDDMYKKIHPTILFATIVIILLTAACAQASTPSQDGSIQGVVWQWVNVTKASTGAVTPVADSQNYTLIFYEDGQLEGKADCNNFNGTYTQENGLKITIGASTMAYCGDQSLDQQFLSMLGNVASSAPYGGGGLALDDAAKENRMIFKNAGVAPAQTSTIQNINWQWQSVTNKTTGEVTTVQNPEKYTIVFNDNGSVDGIADCNTFNGTYSQNDGFNIQIGASSKAYCGDQSLDQQYLSLLESIAAGGPDGSGNLALETAGGEQRMVFVNGGLPPQ
jgi:heat shock protein HslJ